MGTTPEGSDGIPPERQAPGGGVPSCYRHPGRETYIKCSRCERSICPDCMTSAPVGFHCPECVNDSAKSVRQARTVVGGTIREQGQLITYGLIAVNLVVWFVGMVANGRPLTEALALANLTVFVDGGAASLIGVEQGEWYRMITAAFLHEEVWHVALNMFALWILGSALEPVLGRWRFLTLYGLSALGGSAASLIALPVVDPAAAFAGGISLGASGAVFGLFGALFIVAKRFGRDVSSILVILGINVVIGFTVEGIDWRAHLGGLVTGSVIAYAYAHAPSRHRTTYSVAACLLALAAIALVVVSIVP